MKSILLVCLTVVVGILIIGCEDEEYGNEPVPVDYTYAGYVHFDSTEYRWVKRDLPRYNDKIPEPLVNWEQSLGEPFTDLNGNGVYDPGIDSFTISDDPDINQDLNHNGEYDSPDDLWSEGIPFDDIDGNGEFRPDPGDHISGYELGLPYSDYNGNHKHDADLKAAYGVAEWKSGLYYGVDIMYWLVRYPPALYRFVSDSGLNYNLPLSYTPTMYPLIVGDTALMYRLTPYPVTLLKPGTILPEDSTRLAVAYPPDSIIYFRWVSLDNSLTIDGLTFSNLAKVRIGNDDYRYDFYFSRDLGLLSYEYWEDHTALPDNWENYEHNVEYFYRRFDSEHSLVFSTTR